MQNKPNTNGHRLQQCDACGQPFARNLAGRQKKFCSDACRDKARRAINFSVSGRTRPEPRNDSRSACGTGANFGRNAGRGIVGPQCAVSAEVLNAHAWRPLTAEDGECAGWCAYLRPRALRERQT